MKLIDILVQELPKHGGWPEGAVECCRFVDEANIDFYDESGNWPIDCCQQYGGIAQEAVRNKSIPCEHENVTREQYEKALAASQPQWNGEGMPPVGVVCEIAESTTYLHIGHPEGAVVKIYAHFTDDRGVELAAFVDSVGKVGGVCTSKCFRPIRSEAERKRDEAVAALKQHKPQLVGELAGYLYDEIAAGKIPHIQLK